jgi:hypothetical protein
MPNYFFKNIDFIVYGFDKKYYIKFFVTCYNWSGISSVVSIYRDLVSRVNGMNILPFNYFKNSGAGWVLGTDINSSIRHIITLNIKDQS